MQAFNDSVTKWMTGPVITVPAEATIIDADQLMTEHGIRRLPVLENNRLVGIISRGDVREARASAATSLSMWELNYLIARLTVKKIMTKDVTTIMPSYTVADAADIMLNQKVSGLPVVDVSGNLLGILTESDIFRIIVEARREASTSI